MRVIFQTNTLSTMQYYIEIVFKHWLFIKGIFAVSPVKVSYILAMVLLTLLCLSVVVFESHVVTEQMPVGLSL